MTLETARGRSALGAWTYSEWRPPRLRGLVDHLWSYSGPSSHRHKRVFPNGCTEVILNFADPYRLLEGNGTDTCRTTWLSGPQDGPIVIEQPAHQHALGIRLRPAGAHALVARPMREVSGLALDLRDLIGSAATELVERCAAERAVERRFEIVAEWVARRFARAHGMDEAVVWAVGQIEASSGTVPIAALREKTGLSKTRLVSAFRDQVGLAPKLYGRVVRFHQTLAMLQSAPDARLTDVALDASFYDQPHMNAEFRALGGITPSEFLATRHPVGDGTTASAGPAAP